jgi:hypothetical protein
MKFKSILIAAVAVLVLCSWGRKGHKIIALIAHDHIDARAMSGVDAILQGQKMEDVASWADDVDHDDPRYYNTAPWHFLDMGSGLNYTQFRQAVFSQRQPNLYTAILKNKNDLANKQLPIEKRQEALKFLIHLVGDAHQPMHVSREEDKGGNAIELIAGGRNTNLHALWDSGLLDQERKSYERIEHDCDKATGDEVKKWQQDDPMIWLWESYQISSKLYTEVGNGSNLNGRYYKQHVSIMEKRIDQAGIRLAGLINAIFKDDKAKVKIAPVQPSPVRKNGSTQQYPQVDLAQAGGLIGKTVSVKGIVFGFKALRDMTLVDLGAPYPNELLTVVLKGEARDSYGQALLKGKMLSVSGMVQSYHCKPEIVVTDSKYVSIVQDK